MVMEADMEVQEQFLHRLQAEMTPVSIFLKSGIRLRGHIEFFDAYVIAIRSGLTQITYKHAISTVMVDSGAHANGENATSSSAVPHREHKARPRPRYP
jgi:RNA chaperone Hfq